MGYRVQPVVTQAVTLEAGAQPARHPSRVFVKSATYHDLTVQEGAHGWTARIALDI